jgi:hypothetical protein
LSASDRESVPFLGIILGGGHRVLETLGSRESIHRTSQATVLWKHGSLRFHPMPPRITKESHRPRVSDRTMSYRVSERITVTLGCFKKRMAPSRQRNETTDGKNLNVSLDETKQRLPEEHSSPIRSARSND